MRARIIFKSGASAEFDTEDLESRRDPLTGELTNLKWNTPADWTAKLHTVTMSEIAAIVVLRSAEPPALVTPLDVDEATSSG